MMQQVIPHPMLRQQCRQRRSLTRFCAWRT